MPGKSNKIIQQNINSYIDLYYMTSSVIRATDISLIIRDIPGFTVELWEEMNILELELPNQNTVDFEPLEPSFKDPSDAAFIKNRGVKSIFAINLCETDLNTIIPVFEKIITKHSGFLCADSPDFTPVYVGTANRA